jgi:benzoylformate decarboxylase
VGGLAEALGCPARRVDTWDALEEALDDVVPGLAGRETPLVLEVTVEPDAVFEP